MLCAGMVKRALVTPDDGGVAGSQHNPARSRGAVIRESDADRIPSLRPTTLS